MKLPKIATVKTAGEAQSIAIEWQHWQAEQAMSRGELAEYQNYFEALAKKFPAVKEEFKENGII